MKTDTFALMTPAGTQIVGTVDTIPASAAVSGFYEDDDGRLIPEYVGDTEVYWDAQVTEKACGQPIYIDDCGDGWLERECLRVPIGADGELQPTVARATLLETLQKAESLLTSRWTEADEPETLGAVRDAISYLEGSR